MSMFVVKSIHIQIYGLVMKLSRTRVNVCGKNLFIFKFMDLLWNYLEHMSMFVVKSIHIQIYGLVMKLSRTHVNVCG